jgi:hypothetical protein
MNGIEPTAAKLIAYNVGFGDCILLGVTYSDDSRRHVLVDFGSTAMPETSEPARRNTKRANPRDLLEVAHKIDEDCGGSLDVVVVTHRHRDHISGFAGRAGDVIQSLKPKLVLQPWTEDPVIPEDATGTAASASSRGARGLRLGDVKLGLRQLELAAKQVVAVVPLLEARKGVTRTAREQILALGMNNITNRKAVENIQKLSGEHRYLAFGDTLDPSAILPEVTIDVLGPPTLDQSSEVAKMAEVDPVEFWHMAASSRPRTTATRAGRLFPGVEPMTTPPQEARWVIPKIDSMRAEELLSLVRIMDDVLNNTSLILLITIGNARLLFPGDAQLENWRYALNVAPNSEEIRETLSQTTVYKVGHHGSLNATPRRMLWENFARRSKSDTPDRLITVMSTRANKHGSEDRSTEVPRKTLRDELQANSRLVNTQDCTPATQWWREVEIPIT